MAPETCLNDSNRRTNGEELTPKSTYDRWRSRGGCRNCGEGVSGSGGDG